MIDWDSYKADKADIEWRWVQKAPGDWWLACHRNGVPVLDDIIIDGVQYPPQAQLTFAAHEDGKPRDSTCFHYYVMRNGAFPGEEEEDIDYLHICNLDEHVDAMRYMVDAVLGRKCDVCDDL